MVLLVLATTLLTPIMLRLLYPKTLGTTASFDLGAYFDFRQTGVT